MVNKKPTKPTKPKEPKNYTGYPAFRQAKKTNAKLKDVEWKELPDKKREKYIKLQKERYQERLQEYENKYKSYKKKLKKYKEEKDRLKKLENTGPYLIQTIRDNDLTKVQEIYQEFSDIINYKTKKGISPLITATKEGFLNIVQFLVENGVDVNQYDKNQISPLLYAIMEKHVEIAKYLIENGADINHESLGSNLDETFGYSQNIPVLKNTFPLKLATEMNLLEIVKLLVENGAEIDKETSGYNSFVNSLFKKHFDISKYLIDKGTDVNVKFDISLQNFPTFHGITPIMYLAKNGNLELVEHILQKDVDLTQVVNIEYNGIPERVDALGFAVLSGNLEIIKKFVERGLDPRFSSNDYEQDSYLFMAVKQGSLDILEYFLEQGCPLEARNKLEFTPLYHALVTKMDPEKRTKIVEFLVKKGANVNLKIEQRDAFGWCLVKNLRTEAKLILSEGKVSGGGTRLYLNDNICPLCRDDFNYKEQTIYALPCGHVFHEECNKLYIKEKCPCCRHMIG